MIIDYTSTTLRGAVDGKNAIFELSQVPVAATVMVFVNGLFRDPGMDNGWYFDGPQLVNLAEPPQPGDTVAISYDKAVLPAPVVVPPVLPQAPEDPIPVLTPAQYGKAQGGIPDGGNATLLSPYISGAKTVSLRSETGQG